MHALNDEHRLKRKLKLILAVFTLIHTYDVHGRLERAAC